VAHIIVTRINISNPLVPVIDQTIDIDVGSFASTDSVNGYGLAARNDAVYCTWQKEDLGEGTLTILYNFADPPAGGGGVGGTGNIRQFFVNT
jgi:hypothetical protein